MNLTRRTLLMATAAAAALKPFSTLANVGDEELRAAQTDIQLLPENYGRTQIWGFNGMAPGPEIRIAQGQTVKRRLINDLPAPTSVHWHGIRIENSMDGVSGLTQSPVEPGHRFDYDFVAPDAGTYWYHAHNRSFEQVARGLHGALIVEEPEPLDIDHEEVLVLDDWLIDPESAQIVEPFGAMHDLSHAGRLGNYVTTNGQYNLAKAVRRHERLRLRLINAANARIFQLALEGLDGWIVALDGMPLSKPTKVQGSFVLAPAQRMDLLVDVTAEVGGAGHIVQRDRDDSFSQVAFEVRQEGVRARRGEPDPLPPNSFALPELDGARVIDLVMEGGAMGGMRGAMMGGQMSSMRDVMRSGHFWAFNGAVGTMQDEPLASLSVGETVRLRIRNETAFPHAMHLHGMHFFEMQDGQQLGALRDTTLILRGETKEIVLVADNPGQWLLHCHMLSHAASGMTTKIDVS